MKRFLFCFLFALATAGGLVASAADTKEKNLAASAADDQLDDGQQASDKNKQDDDDGKDEEKEEAKNADGKPAAKKTNVKKSGGLKLTTVDETKLLKTLSYMQGYDLGKQVSQYADFGVELDHETLFAAFKDGLEGKEPTMTGEERLEAMQQIQKLVEEKRTAKMQELAVKNKAEGKEFLAENKKKEGVKTLPSGLQYKVLKPGKGEKPKRTDTVKVHYKGSFLNGSEFDSSYRRGQPAVFPVSGQLIPGWTEALQLMKVGDKWELVVPAELAYGEKGNQGGVPPNATLVFEIELLGIEKGGRGLPTLK